MSAGDLSGLAGATWRQHLVGAADAASAAVGLAVLARHLDALDVDGYSGGPNGWTPYTRVCLWQALGIIAAAVHQEICEAGRAAGFDVERARADGGA